MNKSIMRLRISFDAGIDAAKTGQWVIFSFHFATSNTWDKRLWMRLVVCNAAIKIGWWEWND